MSDSDDLGGFGETTPSVPRSHSAAVAGPSRTADNKRKGVHAPVSIYSDDDEVQEVRTKNNKRTTGANVKRRRKEEEQDEPDAREEVEEKRRRRRRDEVELEEESAVEKVQEVVPPGKKGRGDSKRTGKGEPKVNGGSRRITPTGATAKGKGKAKASRHDNAMDVEEVEVVDLDEEDIQAEVEGIANAINSAQRSGKQATSGAKQASRTEREDDNSPLREQLRQANTHIEDLKRQLEELHKLKHTEPEALLHRMEIQYRNERQAHDTLVHDLTEQLTRKNPLLRIGRNAFTQLLTREEADKEMQGLRDQVKLCKVAIQERDEELKKNGEENGKLQTSVQDLRYELQLEIERSKALTDKGTRKQPASTFQMRRGRLFGLSEDPKMSALVKFYEDLTNLLIVDVKPQPARYAPLEEWVITCLYSHQDMVEKSKPTKSFSFKLRQCFDPNPGLQEEPKNMNDFAESLQYTPLGLEGESEDFIESLGFLNSPFTFERDQLALFLRTLHDVVSDDGKEEEAVQVSEMEFNL